MFNSVDSSITTNVFTSNFESILDGVLFALCNVDPETDEQSLEPFNRYYWLGTHSMSEARRGKPYIFFDWEIKIRKEIGLMWRYNRVGVVIHPAASKVVILTPLKILADKKEPSEEISEVPRIAEWDLIPFDFTMPLSSDEQSSTEG
jgi:hypothetical protein